MPRRKAFTVDGEKRRRAERFEEQVPAEAAEAGINVDACMDAAEHTIRQNRYDRGEGRYVHGFGPGRRLGAGRHRLVDGRWRKVR